jgi:UDP-2,3-diacylglucosamine pyrophosphatase LpxH
MNETHAMLIREEGFRQTLAAAQPSVSQDTAASVKGVEPTDKYRFRAIFISDVHLGTYGCQAEKLLDFLGRCDSEYLYLVGDIVDGWRLKQRWYWPQAHNDVLQKFFEKARSGTKVVFIPGNHDEFARNYEGLEIGRIPIENTTWHQTAGGKRLYVMHGDEFDGVVRYGRWLAYIGSWAYDMTVILNGWLNYLRRKAGLPYWSLSAFIKRRVKEAVKFITNFEEALVKHAHEKGADGVVCGHIHHPSIKQKGDVLYLNDGDWVENATALAETYDGHLTILKWESEAPPSVVHSVAFDIGWFKPI